MIVMHREYFDEGARLLLSLAEAENETWSNNATGVFTGLFTHAPAPIAPTQASPEERFTLLKEVVQSTSEIQRRLGLKGCDVALQTHSFMKFGDSEARGLRKVRDLWRPTTWEELFDAYRRVWELLLEQVRILEGDERQNCITIILLHARGLASLQKLSDIVIEGLRKLAATSFVEPSKILKVAIEILRYDGEGMEEDAKQRWTEFRDELTGKDYSSLLRRYVGMNILEDEYDAHGNRTEESKARIRDLAMRALNNPKTILPELSWLVSDKAENGYSFGYELGREDRSYTLLPHCLEALRTAEKNMNGFLVGGYLRGVFEHDSVKWETVLDQVSRDEKLVKLLPELTWRSGMSDEAALRMIQAIQDGRLKSTELSVFMYGRSLEVISEGVFRSIITHLLRPDDDSNYPIALTLFAQYYSKPASPYPLPKVDTLNILLHSYVLTKGKQNAHRLSLEYHWIQLANGVISNFEGEDLRLSQFMIDGMGVRGSLFDMYYSHTREVLDEIAKKYPHEVWEQLQSALISEKGWASSYIRAWLRGDLSFERPARSGALSLMNPGDVFTWVDADLEKRAWMIATFVPPHFEMEDGKYSFVRELLVRYGSREDVRRNLMSNFFSESWVGPESRHYTRRAERLRAVLGREKDLKVIRWLKEFITILEQRADDAKKTEERDDF
jgi:hypothetical protein